MGKIFTWYIISIVLVFTGCSIKQTDNEATKVVKHVVNTPVYSYGCRYGRRSVAGGAVDIACPKPQMLLL